MGLMLLITNHARGSAIRSLLHTKKVTERNCSKNCFCDPSYCDRMTKVRSPWRSPETAKVAGTRRTQGMQNRQPARNSRFV